MSKARELLEKMGEAKDSDIKIAKGVPKQIDKKLLPKDGKTVIIPIAKIPGITGSVFKSRTIELRMINDGRGGLKFWPIVDGKEQSYVSSDIWKQINKVLTLLPRYPGNWPSSILDNLDNKPDIILKNNVSVFGQAMVKAAMTQIRREAKEAKLAAKAIADAATKGDSE